MAYTASEVEQVYEKMGKKMMLFKIIGLITELGQSWHLSSLQDFLSWFMYTAHVY